MTDNLWDRVKEQAALWGISGSELVNNVLRQEMEKAPRLCFYCGGQGDEEWVSTLTPYYRPGTTNNDVVDHLAATGEVPASEFTPATLSLTVCRQHSHSASHVLIEEFGGCTGGSFNPRADYKSGHEDPKVIAEMTAMLRGRRGSASQS